MEELVGTVLSTAHPIIRARCKPDVIVAELERRGAFDGATLRSILTTRFDSVLEKLEAQDAASEVFLSILLEHTAGDAAPAAAAMADASGSEAPTPPPEEKAAPAAAPTEVKQKSIGHFFGTGVNKEYSKTPSGEKVLTGAKPMTEEQLEVMPKSTLGLCQHGCGRSFSHGPAKANHEKVCKGGRQGPAAEAFAATAASAAEKVAAEAAASTSGAAAADEGSATTSDDESDAEEDVPPPPGKAPKTRKDGQPKQSGQRAGEKRTPRTVYFKLEIVKTLRHFEKLNKLGQCPSPNQATCEVYPALLPSDVTKYSQKEEKLRQVLMNEHRVSRKQKNNAGKMALFSSVGARRVSLHPGRTRPFAAAELELHKRYRLRRRGDGGERKGGERVTGCWLRITMKRLVREFYGDNAANGFKASRNWLRNFSRHFGISLRRKTNSKAEPVEVRLPKIKRWHARLRRRLQRRGRDSTVALDPKWGRWLPQNRLAIDQVPMNLRCGDGRTYEDVGAQRVWLAGSTADDGKRFCTLQICARAVAIEDKKRRGQPKLTIIFRGQGKKLNQEERNGWHPDVHVRFQRKAWADDELCEDYSYDEIYEICADAREADEWSVVFADNLSGQTTAKHHRNCRRAHCDRHLLPAGSTGELMLIDGGIGARLKNGIGGEQDTWMEKAENMERWTTSPKVGGLHLWEKRVLVTHWAAAAWDKLCDTYDFEASALRMGMLMTADGTGDDEICVQGLAEYSFTDEDGGPAGAESDAEVDEEDEADVAGGADEDDEEADGGLEDSDEEDDTADEISLEESAGCGTSARGATGGLRVRDGLPAADVARRQGRARGQDGVDAHRRRLVRRQGCPVRRERQGEEGGAEGDARRRVQAQRGAGQPE